VIPEDEHAWRDLGPDADKLTLSEPAVVEITDPANELLYVLDCTTRIAQ
jgi:hypothetical protein